jgi:hypothetical protein
MMKEVDYFHLPLIEATVKWDKLEALKTTRFEYQLY